MHTFVCFIQLSANLFKRFDSSLQTQEMKIWRWMFSTRNIYSVNIIMS